MGRIILRRSDGDHPCLPYEFTADQMAEKDFIPSELGQVYVLPMSLEEGLIIGVGREAMIRIPLATVRYQDNLTQRVYDCVVEYGKRIAESLPSNPDFIDETGGPKNIEFLTLGARPTVTA